MATNKFVSRSQMSAAQNRLRRNTNKTYQQPASTRQAVRITGQLVKIDGQFYPGEIDTLTATVINTGSPSAPMYKAQT